MVTLRQELSAVKAELAAIKVCWEEQLKGCYGRQAQCQGWILSREGGMTP